MTGLAPRRTFHGVQVLRGLAAMLVVLVHVVGNLSDFGWALPARMLFGNAGVDLFFLISGFVIVWTTQDQWWLPNAWLTFLDKRLTRVLPLYWILTTAKLAILLALPVLFRNSHLTTWHAVASYLLIPSTDATGNISPIIDAGWTLCFEMAFYYLCTICMVFRRPPLVYVTPVLVVLGIVGLLRQPDWGAPASLIDPLLLEFAGGMWLAELTRRDAMPAGAPPLVALAVVGLAALIAGEWLPDGVARGGRVLFWGVPCALILYAFLGLERQVDFRRFRIPLLIGNASYSIYLAHVLLLPPLVARVARFPLPPVAQWAAVVGLVAVGAGAGIAVWWLVERRIIRVLLDLVRPLRAPYAARGDTRT